jgi:hypothetical protein
VSVADASLACPHYFTMDYTNTDEEKLLSKIRVSSFRIKENNTLF